jgi:hypothetical protein
VAANDGSGSNNLSAAAAITVNLRPPPSNDFNDDGKPDLLFQNQAIGNSSVMIDLLTAGSISSSVTIADSSGIKAEADGDFNADGNCPY